MTRRTTRPYTRLALALMALMTLAAWADIPWDLEALSAPPKIYPAPGIEAEGVQALFYEGLPYQGKPTRVFAWYGLPDNAKAEKLPAMVLVHGGGGTAFAEWVRLWTSRGYAAIAMDTCGALPGGQHGKRPRHDHSGPPGWGGFERIDDPVTDQWTYHAVADVILAHSLLRSFPEVDPQRIGITGISWGGYLTCIVSGIDTRFRFAVPVYGCGFLGEDSAWLDQFKAMGGGKAAKWLRLWDPSSHLPRAALPMLWVTGTNDFAYPMNSLQRSYRLPTGERTLCVRLRMPHAHGGAGENPKEIHAFANSILGDGVPMAKITGQGREGRQVWATFTTGAKLRKAELNYTKAGGKWPDRHWESVAADITSGKVSAKLPESATVYYLNLIDKRGLVVSTEHEELP